MAAQTQKLRYHGTGGTLFGIVLLNGLFSLLTLGMYSFWAKTRLRRYYYSETELAGDRFEYHGTGRELLVGGLKAGAFLMVLYTVYTVLILMAGPAGAGAPPSGAQMVVTLFLPLALFALLPIAINGARRYRLSRSSWRGIRFAFVGRWREYLNLVVRGGLLSLVTFGLYLPFFQNQARAFLVNNARFGSQAFRYQADGRALFGAYLKALLLTIPTLGLSWVWYAAFRHRYFWSHTSVGAAGFRSTVSGGGLLGLALTNFLLVALTFGLATPWALTRMMHFTCDNLSLRGNVDWDMVEQQARPAGSTAEGMADGLDVEVDVGLGM